jgi:hypothetical protein
MTDILKIQDINDMSDKINVKLGPVVGITENDKIRILLECDNKISVNIKLTVYSGKEIENQNIVIYPGSNIILVNLLDISKNHKVVFENVFVCDKQATCSFDPVIKETAIISCDGDGLYHYKTGNKQKAWKTVKNVGVNFAIHIGDQVYVDDAYKTGMKHINKQTTNEQATAIFEKEIRQIYYDSWFNCEEKRFFLASCSNIMIIDDHDIYDNFTSYDFLENVLTMDRMNLFINVASKIAGEYQISLSQNKRILNYQDLLSISKVTVLENTKTKFVIVNSRLTKTPNHMFDIKTKQLITNNVTLFTKKKIVFVDQVSPFLLSHQYTQVRLLYKIAGIDITDHITYNKKWIADYNWLFNTLCTKDSNKVVYVTGDLHAGQNHELVRNIDSKRIRCLTSSPMSSNIGLPNNSVVKYLMDNCSQQYDGFSYDNNLIYKNNFVVVTDDTEKIYEIN